MRALYVYESLDFERGQDPKDTIGVGRQWNEVELTIEGKIRIDPGEYDIWRESEMPQGGPGIRKLKKTIYVEDQVCELLDPYLKVGINKEGKAKLSSDWQWPKDHPFYENEKNQYYDRAVPKELEEMQKAYTQKRPDGDQIYFIIIPQISKEAQDAYIENN